MPLNKNIERLSFICIGVFIILTICVGCGGSEGLENTADYIIPEQLDDGWTVSSLTDQGVDEGNITNLHNQLIRGTNYPGVDSLLIFKNNYLVFEGYYNGQTRDDPHPLYSVTKSVSSAMIGIAIGNGFIQNVDELIFNLLPEYDYINWPSGKDQITIEDLLTMRSGLDWDELSYPYSDYRNSEWQMEQTSDWLEFVLQRPMTSTPGTNYVYNTGTSNLFARLIENTTGSPIDEFAQNNLFEPLGITGAAWFRDTQGNPCTGGSEGGLVIRPRDMAKFGFLYLNDGVWGGSQVVPSGWVEESLSRHVVLSDDAYYGYQWWQQRFYVQDQIIDAWFALGFGGQFIYIIDELDLIVVFTSSNYFRDYARSQIVEIMNVLILPAVL